MDFALFSIRRNIRGKFVPRGQTIEPSAYPTRLRIYIMGQDLLLQHQQKESLTPQLVVSLYEEQVLLPMG